MVVIGEFLGVAWMCPLSERARVESDALQMNPELADDQRIPLCGIARYSNRTSFFRTAQ